MLVPSVFYLTLSKNEIALAAFLETLINVKQLWFLYLEIDRIKFKSMSDSRNRRIGYIYLMNACNIYNIISFFLWPQKEKIDKCLKSWHLTQNCSWTCIFQNWHILPMIGCIFLKIWSCSEYRILIICNESRYI